MAADDLDPIILNAENSPAGVFQPTEYVAIKPEMNAGDYATTQNALGRVKQQADGSVPEIHLQIGDAMLATLQTMIVGWQVNRKSKQLDGTVKDVPLEYSSANVARLPRRIFDYVYSTMNKLYQEDNAQTQLNFTSPAAAPTATS